MSALWVGPLVLVALSLGWFAVQRAWLACMERPADSDALVLMAGIRERLRLADVPDVAQGMAITLMLAGILSLAFMGFAGIGAAS